jgi:hypothetical protein
MVVSVTAASLAADSSIGMRSPALGLAPDCTLKQAHQSLDGDPPSTIPFIVWLFENPNSPLAFPGNIDLYGHDCLHILLDRGFSLDDEAYVVGFTMGNDLRVNRIHIALIKVISRFLYPPVYRFNRSHLESFDLGVMRGKKAWVKNLNQFNFLLHQQQTIAELKQELGI